MIRAIDADKRRMPLSNTSSADYPGEESSFAAIAKQPTEPGGKLKKRKINMKLQNLIHILIGIVCIGLLPGAQAVVPPPGGGHPGGNTAEGSSALLRRTTGFYNTAIGMYSLLSVTTGSFNTGIDSMALYCQYRRRNTATGAGALLSSTTGPQNTANGAFALVRNTQSSFNTATDDRALFSNTPATSTPPMVLLRSSAALQAPSTRLSVVVRFLVTPPVS